MRVRADRSSFTIVTAEGRHRRYSWLTLVPALVLPVVAVLAVIFLSRDGTRGVAVDTENLFRAEPPSRTSALPTIRLIVPNNTLVDMQRGKERDPIEYNALLEGRKPPRACEIALLDGPEWKRRSEKPSLAVKIRRVDATDGPRRWELHRPADPLAMERRLAVALAREDGMMWDGGEPVRLFVNNKFLGVYLRTWRPGNRMTRSNRRTWGRYFTSDAADRWIDPTLWIGAGQENEKADGCLRALCAVLSESPSADTFDRLERVLDVEGAARWAAILAATAPVAGGPPTTLFFSPHRGRLEIVAGTIASGTWHEGPSLDDAPDRLLHHLGRNADWALRRNRHLRDLLERRLAGGELSRRIREATEAARRDLAADRHLGLLQPTYWDGRMTPFGPAIREIPPRFDPVATDAVPQAIERLEEGLLRRREQLLQLLDAAPAPAETKTDDVVLGPGDVTLAENLLVGERQTLTIRAGTRLRLAPGVGIYSRGKVLVEGTADAPVTIRADGFDPWGALGIMGRETAGSRLAWLDVEGGAGGSRGPVTFRGMVSVYDCPDLTIVGCRFGPSWDGEDSVNLLRTTVSVSKCEWRGSTMDGLDLEVCDGSLVDCKFEGCGDDGIDVMMSRLRIVRCEVRASVDKGLSVSDDSRITLVASRIAGCETGIEVMDGSRLLGRKVILEDNGVAVRTHRKRRQFDRGGEVALVDGSVRGSREFDLVVLKRTEVILCGTEVATVGIGDHRVETVDELGPDWAEAEE